MSVPDQSFASATQNNQSTSSNMPTAASTPFAMPAPPTPLTQQSVQYQELLSTISELQLDLQRTVGLASKLKNENAGVRK